MQRQVLRPHAHHVAVQDAAANSDGGASQVRHHCWYPPARPRRRGQVRREPTPSCCPQRSGQRGGPSCVRVTGAEHVCVPLPREACHLPSSREHPPFDRLGTGFKPASPG